jgi:hypothetical protein
MTRARLLLVLMGSVGLIYGPGVAPAGGPKKGDDAAVIAIERGGGLVDPAKSPLAYYWFTVAKNGAWQFKPLKGDTRKGKLGADDVARWVKEIEDGGFAKLKSNPALGAADESYMDITVRARDRKEQKRIRLEEKLAQALEKKVLELAKPGK